MKKLILYAAWLLLITPLQAQTPTILWETFFGSAASDVIYSISYNQRQKSYIGAGRQPTTAYMPILIKTDSIGNLIWIKDYLDTLGSGAFMHSQLNDDGTAYIIGRDITKWINSTAYKREMILHLDSLGNIIWTYEFYSNINYPQAKKVVSLKNGYLLVTGDVPNIASGGRDFFAMLLTATGNLVWERKYAFVGTELLSDVLIEPDGSFMLVGRRDQPVFGMNPFFLKIDVNGDTIFSKNYITQGKYENTLYTTHTPDKGYVVTGIYSTQPLVTGYMTKLDSNFNEVWSRTLISGSAYLHAKSLKDGNIFGAYFKLITSSVMDTAVFRTFSGNSGNTITDVPFSQNGGIGIAAMQTTDDNHVLAAGSINIPNVTQGQDFYIAKIGNVGESYDVLRDICELSPPKAEVAVINGANNSFTFNNISYSGLLYNEYMRYHWDFGDGSTDTVQNPTHTYSSNNVDTFIVTLVITNFYGCQDTLQVTNIATNPTIVSSLLVAHTKPSFNFSIYPNPAKEEVSIILTTPSPRVNHPQPLLNEGGELNATTPSPSLVKEGSIERKSPPILRGVRGGIFNLQGKQLQTFTLQNEQITLSLRGLPSGMYIIQLQTEQGSVSKKLVKK